MEQPFLPVVVAFHSLRWMPVVVVSYLRHFPGHMMLVVDNNPDPGQPGWDPECDAERRWLRAQPDLLMIRGGRPGGEHGEGVDRAVAWCREAGVDRMLLLEPDCLVSGRRWADALVEAIDRGAWMAGSHRKQYGPIHPAPSLWRVGEITTSFAIQGRADDLAHPRFRELFDLDWLVAATAELGTSDWWRDHWDTAQRAWFLAAVEGRAALAPETPDFRHFWCGSSSNRHPPEEVLREALGPAPGGMGP